tara:strand:+ start:248 stop:1171 length:924 start_codon:yes stop_codon:yes gene_type:complete
MKFQANKILVIKHGSLGDIAFSLTAINSIRQAYINSEIHLLTESRFSTLFKRSNYFDKIIKDDRKNIFLSLAIIFKIISNNYDLIIDLQNSQRTNIYNFLIKAIARTKISSSRSNAHFRYIYKKDDVKSAAEGLFNQLKLINVFEVENNFDWLETEVNLTNNTILLIPGVSKSGIKKQWMPENFGKLANYFIKKNLSVVVVGTSNDNATVRKLQKECPNIISMIDNSPPELIYSIAKLSKLVVTNDTGPGHIASLSKSKILWLAINNSVSNLNLPKNEYSFKILDKNMSLIKIENVINFIEINNLLN